MRDLLECSVLFSEFAASGIPEGIAQRVQGCGDATCFFRKKVIRDSSVIRERNRP
jgi:hypothetical protein